MKQLKIGDWFWEYNSDLNAGYRRIAHSEKHIEYFWNGYNKRAFFTKEELLSVYPDAIVENSEILRVKCQNNG